MKKEDIPLYDGPAYDPTLDKKSLIGQTKRVFDAMKDGKFRTLREIEDITGDPQSSISAQLRHLRKERFGSHTVNRQRRELLLSTRGIHEYQLIVEK